MKRYWILKSEPSTFSILDLEQRGTEPWDGVRNYQARNFIRQMKPQDEACFYHSSCPQPGLVGWVRIHTLPYGDPSALDPRSPYFDPKSTTKHNRWSAVGIEFAGRFTQTLGLAYLKTWSSMAESALIQKGNRLSVMPLSPEAFAEVILWADRLR